MAIALRPFQKRFLRGALAPGIDVSVLSVSRGQGKSALAGHLLTRILTPSDPLFRPGTESVLMAGSIEQARIVFRFVRADLEPLGGYRFLDSNTRIGILHKASNTRLRVISSNAKTAMGLVGCPWAVCDEPGSWQTAAGELMRSALFTARGKPGSPLRILMIGTVAPAMVGWWPDLVARGSHGSIYVQAIQGNVKRWDKASEIAKSNPLMWKYPESRKVLLRERDAARTDSREKASFLSFRHNRPAGDSSTMLLTVADWERVCARPVGERTGRPVVGVDLGGGRSWSAAVAIYPSGRIEALAVAPGTPSIADQERRDRVPTGTYQRLADAGLLLTDGKRRVPRVGTLMALVMLWRPVVIICDRFRLAELQDAIGGRVRLVPRVQRWSEESDDIRALRRGAADSPGLSCAPESRALVGASLAVAAVKTDDQGSVRLTKQGSNASSRDDCAAALKLAAGAHSRRPAAAPRRRRLIAV